MKYILSLVLVLFSQALTTGLQAQTSNSNINLYQVAGTKAPDAASLGKFGNVPVSYSTGVPSINIPIYDINIGELKIPVSLAYHAGGIRVDEMASSVGLGWALNAGGTISRSMVGLPDEGSGGYLLSPDFKTVTSTTGESSLAFPYRFREGNAEISPDIFSYDVGDIHGKFIFRRAGNGKTFLQLPMTNNRIERTTNNTGDFKITSTKGIQYYFENQEQTTQKQGYTSAWKLTKIVNSTLADTVYFSYEKATSNTGFIFTNSTYVIGTTAFCGGFSDIFGGSRSTESSTTTETYLKEIKWRNGKVTFDLANDRSDYPGGRRVRGVSIYNFKNNVYSLLKNVSLYHSHFNSVKDNSNLTASDSRNFRLKLDSVLIKNASNALPQPYRLTYNTTSMAPVGSFAQDMFGFQNGAFGNNDPFPLMKTFHTTSGNEGVQTMIGSADRNFNKEKIQAGVLTSMSYPTGGKTTFEVEPHQFSVSSTDVNNITRNAVSWISGGNGVLSSINTFVFTEGMKKDLTFRYSFSPYAGLANDPSYARIYDQTDQKQIVRFNSIGYSTTGYSSPTSLYASSGFPQFIVGHTYSLETYIFSDAIGLSSSLTLAWNEIDTSTGAQTQYGGGLRIKKITDYGRGNEFISSKTYTYGNNEDGNGILLTPAVYLGYNEQSVIYRVGCSDPNSGGVKCLNYQGNRTYVMYQNSVLPLSQFSGSPVMYNSVTEYQVNANDVKGNGKSIFGFNISTDNNAFPTGDYKATGIALISNSWKNGLPALEEHYKYADSKYTLVDSKNYRYQFHQLDSEPMIYIKSKYIASGCMFTNQESVAGDFEINGYDVPSGIMRLDSTINIVNNNNQSVKTRVNYFYVNSDNYNPSSKESILSDGQTLKESFSYPTNFASTAVYKDMITRNIIDPVIINQRTIGAKHIKTTNTNYASFLSGKVLTPKTIEVKNGTGLLEQRIVVNGYDSFGNILDQQLVSGIHNSYIWGYKNTYPIAEIKNAAPSEVFIENFEEASGTITAGAHTGDKYASAFTVNWKQPNDRAYVITFWYKKDGMWYFKPEASYDTKYVLTGGDGYDDVRVYPKDAIMATYTYEPLVGITSKIDEKSKTIYYEYDGFQRLEYIRDQNRNIITRNQYNYKQ